MNNLKRIHLFEFHDLPWFPQWMRRCITRLIIVMHNLMRSHEQLAELVSKALQHSSHKKVIDLCSGSGGPMLKAHNLLKEKSQKDSVELLLTDLYPDKQLAEKLAHSDSPSGISYLTKPVDAANVDPSQKGVRTMVGSFHHMKPETARSILEDAKENHQPICIFEISDNSAPIFLWWIALPINFIMALFITPLVRPLRWEQIVFTYIIPIIPLCFAWDGAVSNARTYTLNDMDELLRGLEADDYKWEKGEIKGKTTKLYLLGLPV